MIDVIKELKGLIVPIKKGSSGYVSLSNSDRVTAHKINVIINKIKGVSEWISVAERLPCDADMDDEGKVFIVNADGGFGVDCHHYDADLWSQWHITHWMKKPNEPKGGE